MGTPTRFFSGISTQKPETLFGDFPFPDPFHTGSSAGKDLTVYANDYLDTGSTVAYTVTGASSTFALADGVGGVAVLTPGGTTTATSMYRTAAAFQLSAGNKFWFAQRLKFSGVGTGITGYFGFIKTGGATTDSLLFKLAATGVLSLVGTVGSTVTTLVASVTTVAAATWVDVGLYYDGTDLLVYVDDALVARITAPTIGSSGTTLPDAALTIITQITPAATETVTSDYVLAAQEVTR